ncbi:nitric oxide synthase oxygenase, partial [Staphylococcus haemolyticus]
MLLEEARRFIETMYHELNYNASQRDNRLKEIEEEIQHTGTYTHTFDELAYGAKLAWRNSNRCIGRLFWDSLHVEDARNVDNEHDFINAINHHLKYATNDGKIKPYITIFSPDQAPRIFNNQLIRYAGYEHCGDPSEREVTQLAEH